MIKFPIKHAIKCTYKQDLVRTSLPKCANDAGGLVDKVALRQQIFSIIRNFDFGAAYA